MSNFEMGKLYRELDASWQQYIIGRRFHSFSVPTELVATTARIVIPRQSRSYQTYLFIDDNGNPLPYNELQKTKRCRGVHFERTVSLVEVWTDRGDDGHVQYVQIGWRFIPTDTLQWVSSFIGREPGLPEAMLEQWWDYA